MKYIIILTLIIGLGYGIYAISDRNSQKNSEQNTRIDNPDSVISYITKNISDLSSQKEVLGGTFYLTNITLDAGTGVVEYEDGHNAYMANFEYTFSENGEVIISSFDIVE